MVKAVHIRNIETFPQLSDVGRLLEQIARKDESARTELFYATIAMARLDIRRFVYDSENAEELFRTFTGTSGYTRLSTTPAKGHREPGCS